MRRRALGPARRGLAGRSGSAPVAGGRDATWADFGTPTATSSFDGRASTSAQPVTVSEPAGRVELLLTVADAIGPTVVEVPEPPTPGRRR